jgi:hypothetical protein
MHAFEIHGHPLTYSVFRQMRHHTLSSVGVPSPCILLQGVRFAAVPSRRRVRCADKKEGGAIM